MVVFVVDLFQAQHSFAEVLNVLAQIFNVSLGPLRQIGVYVFHILEQVRLIDGHFDFFLENSLVLLGVEVVEAKGVELFENALDFPELLAQFLEELELEVCFLFVNEGSLRFGNGLYFFFKSLSICVNLWIAFLECTDLAFLMSLLWYLCCWLLLRFLLSVHDCLDGILNVEMLAYSSSSCRGV